MDNNRNTDAQEIQIDLQRLMKALYSKTWLIVIVSVLAVILTFAGTLLLATPLYQSTTMFYVNNNSVSLGDASLSITSADITASKNLVNSYIIILKTRGSLNDVIDYAGVDRTYGELTQMITAEAVNATEIFKVVVTSPDPQEAEKIANAIGYILPKRISSIIEGTSAKVVDSAVVATKPSSPNYTKNCLVGFLLGFVLSVGFVALREIFDISIRTEEDITQTCPHPILASVPDMTLQSKGGYYYGYGKSRDKKSAVAGKTEPGLLGKDISFAASEAYKLLRTKLQFSFTDENGSHVIGVSSSLSGEGKSLSAVNLAYALSQLEKKVILIDCDMRRPTLAEKLNVQKRPGLSSFLTGQSSIEGLVQYCNIPGDEQAFHVIAAGQNPPNPMELLSSQRMTRVLRGLRKSYDYIILDLPPVSEVGDALAVAKETDGMLLVVRQNYCDRLALNETVRQFEFIGAKILGVINNCTVENSGSYGKGYYKKYGKKYGKRYYSRYYASAPRYEAAAKANSDAEMNEDD